MNLTPRWVPFLNESGYQAEHWSRVGNPSATDQEICSYARSFGFVVLTNDLDFPQILPHTKESKPSLILLRGEPLTPEIRERALLQALKTCKTELEGGVILSLDWFGKPRARLLPL